MNRQGKKLAVCRRGGHQHAFPNTCLSLRLARKTVANFNATTTMAQQHAIHNSEG